MLSIRASEELAHTHGRARRLKGYPQSVDLVPTTSAPSAAMIFVHGYSGESKITWSDFASLLPLRTTFASFDIFFYDYDGIQSELDSSVLIFQRFLIAVAEDQKLVSGSIDFTRPRGAYGRIVVVGHSLGGVLARWAVGNCAVKLKKPWAQNISLVLYAPAHCGARVVELAMAAYEGLAPLKAIAKGAEFKSPLIEQLRKGSQELEKLRALTKTAIQNNCRWVIPRLIVTAEKEHIVFNEEFLPDDPTRDPISGTFHDTVCKPRLTFLDPLNRLDEVI